MLNYLTTLALAFGLLAAGFAAEEPAKDEQAALKPEKMRELNLLLLGKFSDSIAETAYSFKTNARNEMPDFTVSYLCPACGRAHSRPASTLIEEQQRWRTPAFAVAPDRFIASDIGSEPEFQAGLAVEFKGRSYAAEIEAYYPDHAAVLIKTAEPVAGIVPLQFKPEAEGKPYAFFKVTEGGIPVASTQPLSNLKVVRDLGGGFDTARVPGNLLVVNEAGELILLSMHPRLRLADPWRQPPDAWRKISAADDRRQLDALASTLKENVYPVHLRLNPVKQNPSSRYSRGEPVRNEYQGYGVKLADGRVLITVNLAPGETARLAGITIYLDGGREVAATFAGSLRHFGAFVAVPGETLPGGGFPLFDGDLVGESGVFVHSIFLKTYSKSLDIRVRAERLYGLSTGFRDFPVPEVGRNRAALVLSGKGELMGVRCNQRRLTQQYGNTGRMVSPLLLAELLRDFDPANVPSEAGDQIAWLGVEFQQLNEELARFNDVSSFTGNGTYGFLVSFVYPDSPAARMGIKVGNVVVSITPEGSNKPELLGPRYGMYQRNQFHYNWDNYDAMPVQFLDDMPAPWGSTRNELNNFLGKIGIGRRAKAAVVSDGKLTEREFAIAAAPESFESIAKYADDRLGISVCDLTYEVINFFQLKPADRGVIIAKVKPGSRAAVAGIKPYEIIFSIDGEAVDLLADFKRLTAGKRELNIGVRRLAVTRVATIKLD